MDATLAQAPHPTLGRPLGTHRSRITGNFFAHYTTIAYGLGLVSGVVMLPQALRHESLEATAGAVIAVVYCAWWVHRKVSPWFQRVTTYEHGLVWKGVGLTKVVRWDEVSAVYKRVTVDRTERVTYLVIERVRGMALKIHHALEGMERVFDTVVERTRGPILERALACLRGGRDFTFGAIAAKPTGLLYAGEHLPWFQIADVIVRGGELVVQGFTTGPVTWSVPLDNVANPDVLRATFQSLRRG